MAEIIAQNSATTGLTPTFIPAVNADHIVNDGRTKIRVRNTSGVIVTVTCTPSKTCERGTAHTDAGPVPATTGDVTFGPFPRDTHGDRITLTFSATASVTVAALRA